MKKVTLFFFLAVFALSTFASLPVNAPTELPKATELRIPLFKSDKTITLSEFLTLTPNEYKNITGKKLNLIDKAELKMTQKQLKKCVAKDGTVDVEKVKKFAAGDGGFHLGGFALGLLLGLIGVLIAYLIKDDKKAQRTKWAWIGLAVLVVLSLIGLVL